METVVSSGGCSLLDYPKLMRGTKSRSIYLMIEDKVGVKLRQGSGDGGLDDKPGTYYTDWNMDTLEDFNGTVTLYNSIK